jgi:hypothetical protein
MIFIRRSGREEAEMHTQIAHPLVTETGTVYLVECEECGPLGLFSAASVGDEMYGHAQEKVS